MQDSWIVHLLGFYQAALNMAANAAASSGKVATYVDAGAGTFQPSRTTCHLLTAPAAWWLLSLPLAQCWKQRLYVMGLLLAMLLANAIAGIAKLPWMYKALWLALAAAPLPELMSHAWCVPRTHAVLQPP
jgi:hypothetical protein